MVIFMIFALPYYLNKVKGYSQLLLCEAPNCHNLSALRIPSRLRIEMGFDGLNPDPKLLCRALPRGIIVAVPCIVESLVLVVDILFRCDDAPQ